MVIVTRYPVVGTVEDLKDGTDGWNNPEVLLRDY